MLIDMWCFTRKRASYLHGPSLSSQWPSRLRKLKDENGRLKLGLPTDIQALSTGLGNNKNSIRYLNIIQHSYWRWSFDTVFQRAIVCVFCSRQFLEFFGLCSSLVLLLFLLFLLLCFSASAFPASFLFYFYYCMFFSVMSMCFCCSTSCSSASCLYCLFVFFGFSFALLFVSNWTPKVGEEWNPKGHPKEPLNNTSKNPA